MLFQFGDIVEVGEQANKQAKFPYASAGLTVQPEFSDAGKGSVTHFSTRTWIPSVFASSGQ